MSMLCYESLGIFNMRTQVSEVVLLTQFARKLNLTFRPLVPPVLRAFLSLKLAFLFLFPPLRLFLPFFLFLPGCWLPFWSDDCMESTLTIWVGWHEAVACPEADWLIDNWLTYFTTKPAGLVLVQPTMPLACGPGLTLGSKTRMRSIMNDLI